MHVARARVPREAWIDEALRAITRGGAAAVAVDPLATALGISRGSFYWHFADRDELLRAALERWERAGTDELIGGFSAIDDPGERLGALFSAAVDDDQDFEGFEAALAADASHPLVGPVLARVTERRLEYLTDLFEEAGLDAAAARQRAVAAYAVYVGWIQLRRCCGDQVPEVTARGGGRENIAEAVRRLMPSPAGRRQT